MAKKTIEVPDIGDFTDVPVIDVHIAVGDQLQHEDSLISLESAKAVMDIPSPVSGEVLEVLIQEGDKVSQGTPIAVVEAASDEQQAGDAGSDHAEDADAGAPPEDEPEADHGADRIEQEELPHETPEKTPEVPVNKQEPASQYHATPSARQFARRIGVDLSQVAGSGPHGRILTTDIEAAAKQIIETRNAPAGGAGLPPVKEYDFSSFGPTEERELTRIQKISGPHIHASWMGVPHVTHYDEADVTDLEAFRVKLNKETDEKHSILSLVIPAVVYVLKKYPDFNASLHHSGEKIIQKRYYHIGIAVDTPQGLVVPVIRDADTKGVLHLTAELREISKRARDGKLKPQDLSGGSFSISSLGGIGGVGFTPIINVPEVAILGLSRMQKKPVWDEESGQFIPRLVLPFSVSYDHRVIDGAAGARFARDLGDTLNDIRRILLG